MTAAIDLLGAELHSLTDSGGRELMTDADPAFWSGRSPLLFPIIGRLHEDRLQVGGAEYPMQRHGFARRSMFELVEHRDDRALFRLRDNTETREQYPFAFELDAAFRVEDATLFQNVTVRNRDTTDLPFSFGYHPAFAWPLPFGGERADHVIRFAGDEPGTLRRVTPYGTIDPALKSSPVDGNMLKLTDDLFADDALVWEQIKSRSLTYGAPGFPSLRIDFPDTFALGIWTKPGAAFICVEPWAGIADPEGYIGDFTDKPGIMHLPPGEERSFRINVTLLPD